VWDYTSRRQADTLMIVRPDGDMLILITQPDHARLSADMAEAWRADGLPVHPQRARLLLAIREHDNGWIEPDSAPAVNPTTGHPFDFVSTPAAIKQAIWPRAVARLEHADPLAAAFVAEHALTVLADHRSDPEWRSFFTRVTASRDALLERCEIQTPDQMAAFRRGYRLLYLVDFLSLAFCNGWTQTFAESGYRFALTGDRLVVAPDPFAGSQVTLSVPARRISNRRYATEAALQRILEEAKTSPMRGTAMGLASLDQSLSS